ncbi:MAG: hypothetical protein ACYDHZ_00905 [Dehalococcoidia bacterium]
MPKEFDPEHKQEHYELADTSHGDMAERLKAAQDHMGLKDVSCELHLNDTTTYHLKTFFVIGYRENGKLFFMGSGAAPAAEVLAMAVSGIEDLANILGNFLNMSKANVMKAASEDRLMKAIIDHQVQGQG